MEQKGLSTDSAVYAHHSSGEEGEIHSNNDKTINDIVEQLDQFKVNTSLVNDMALRIKELEHELKLKSILLDEQMKINETHKKTIYKLKRDNKDMKLDLKAIQRVVFKEMINQKEVHTSDFTSSGSKAYNRESDSGLITLK